MLVGDHDRLDRFGGDPGDGEALLENPRCETGVDKNARTLCLDENCIAAAATAKNPQLHQALQRILCASASCFRAFSPSSTCRRDIARSATTRNLAMS